MIELEAMAQQRLARYLGDVRGYLQACPSVDPDEIERDVREHVEHEFEEKTGPVSAAELEPVLQKLGSPMQWVPAEDLPWWRRIWLRLQSGSEEWRLAYLSFGLLLAAVVLVPFFMPLLLASFIVARATISINTGADEKQAIKWLVYPSMVIVYAFAGAVILFGPTALLFGLAQGFDHPRNAPAFDRFPWNRDTELAYWLIAIVFIGGLTGVWWLLVATICRKWPRLPGVLFHPFYGKVGRTPMNWIIAIVAVITVACFVIGTLMVQYPGWYDVLSTAIPRSHPRP